MQATGMWLPEALGSDSVAGRFVVIRTCLRLQQVGELNAALRVLGIASGKSK